MKEELATQNLVSQAKAGSSKAVEELCRRYQQRVLAAVRLRIGKGLRRKVESWDIVQEAMIDAFKGIDAFDFRTEGAFLKYVNKIVENRIRDAAQHWKAKRRDVDREMRYDAPAKQDEAPRFDGLADNAALSPSRVISTQEDLALLEQAMDLLGQDDPVQQELIIAMNLEGRTYSELSEELGISVDAVRMRSRRAMESLAKIFRRLERS